MSGQITILRIIEFVLLDLENLNQFWSQNESSIDNVKFFSAKLEILAEFWRRQKLLHSDGDPNYCLKCKSSELTAIEANNGSSANVLPEETELPLIENLENSTENVAVPIVGENILEIRPHSCEPESNEENLSQEPFAPSENGDPNGQNDSESSSDFIPGTNEADFQPCERLALLEGVQGGEAPDENGINISHMDIDLPYEMQNLTRIDETQNCEDVVSILPEIGLKRELVDEYQNNNVAVSSCVKSRHRKKKAKKNLRYLAVSLDRNEVNKHIERQRCLQKRMTIKTEITSPEMERCQQYLLNRAAMVTSSKKKKKKRFKNLTKCKLAEILSIEK